MESGQREGTSAQADPRLVDKLVEELKSQGMFDQIRKDCLAEVDTKPAYQNLRSRVEDTVSRYLARQSRNWSPSVNKNQLRNQLRRHIQESKYMEDGVERIVDQVVNPKILSAIQPGVESIICNYLGIDKIEDGQEEDAENGNMDPMAVDRFASPLPASRDTKHRRESITEKLSNVSSEDIEMRSTGESCDEKKQPKPPTSDASSPGLGPRRNVSPLTPDLKSNSEGRSPDLRGNVSPLTPPPLPPPPPPGEASSSRSPQTPPLPPSLRQEEEEESMSPVSDTELADISPPDQSPETPNDNDFPSPPQNDFMVPPPPPPLPSYMPLPPPLPASIEGPSAPRTPPPLPPPPPDLSSSAAGRPPSPFTSPIGSSSDELDIPEPPPPQTATPYVRAVPSASSVSASDISDTDLPASSQSDGEKETVESDLEALEAERVKLRAQLERAKIESEFEDGQADSSECDVQSSDSDAKAAKSKVVASQRVDVAAAAAAAEPESLPLLDSGASPISSTDQSSTPPEAERIDDHEEEKAKFRQGKDDSDNDDDDDGWKGSGGRLPSSETLASSGSSAKGDKGSEVKKENGGSSAAVGKTASTGSDKSRHRTSSSSHRSHHRRQDSRPKDRKRSSSSKSSKQHRSESKSAVVPDVANSAEEALKQRKEKCFADCAKKDEKKEKEKRRSEKYGKMEEKVSKADKLKSDKFQSFDMFAPKPKPKPHVSRPSSSASSASLSSSLSSPSALGLVTPPTFGSKTPPSFGHKNHQPKSVSSAAPPKKDDVNHHQQPPPGVKCEKPLNRSVADAKQLMKREKVARLELLEPQRKVFPELPVSRIEGDKLKQHEDDYLAAKRNLQRKREELIQQKELEKLQTKRKSGSFSEEHGRQRRKSFVDEDLGSSPREPRRKSVSSRKSHSTDDSDVERRDGGKQRPTKEPENATAVSRRSRRVKHGFCNDEENSDENSATEQDNLEQRMEEILGQQPDEVLTPAAPPTPSKSRWENEADNLLKSDRETKQLLGFDDDDLVGLPRSTLLFDYLLRAADSLAHVSLSQEEEDEMIETIPFVCSDDFIYLDSLSEVRGGNQKLVQILKRFGGNPKLVQPVPQWLQSKLARWKLKRHEVELIYTPATVRKRKGFVTEAEYDVRYPELVEPQDKKLKYDDDDDDDGNESSGQLLDTPSHESQSDGGEEGDEKAVPEDDVMEAAAQQENQEKISDGFHGFTTRDVNRNVTSILIKDSHEEDVDSNGNTFGMIPQQHVNFERDVTVKDHDDRFRFMSVAMSSSLVDHMKILLEGEEGDWKKSLELLSTAHEDRTVLKESEGSSSGSEFNLPPSPISCPSSNYSEKSTNSPVIKESSSRPNGKGEVEKSQVPLAPASIERVVERYSNFCT